MVRGVRACVAVLTAACWEQASAKEFILPASPFLQSQPEGTISCGGHFAESCSACAGDVGEEYCNGDCSWIWGHCKIPSFLEWVEKVFIWDTFKNWKTFLPYVAYYGLLMLAYACVYKSKIVDELPHSKINEIHGLVGDLGDGDDREVGLFQCFTKPSQCLWVLFCAPVVAAKNYDQGKVMSFWPACFLIYIGTYTCFFPFWIVMACFRASLSTRLAAHMGLKTSLPWNFYLTLYCFPCQVGRESIEVDKALGVELECPFKVGE